MAVRLAIAFFTSLTLTPPAMHMARRWNVMDRPGPLKVHSKPVPYLGGVAVFLGIAGVVVSEHAALVLPLALAFALGLADDVVSLPAGLRLFLEGIIGAVAAAVLPYRGPAAALLVAVLVVVLLNAVNLLDGLDGLAAGVTLAGSSAFILVTAGATRSLSVATVGAVAGFLVWNRPPARIYLGDSGSYLLGTTMALLLAAVFLEEPDPLAASGAVLFVGVPVADTVIAIMRRWLARRPLFTGDRSHVYDQLVDSGRSNTSAVLMCVGAQAGLCAAGLGISRLDDVAAFAATSAIVVVVGVAALWRFGRPRC